MPSAHSIDPRAPRFVDHMTPLLLKHYFTQAPPDYLKTAEGQTDLLHHVAERYEMFAHHHVPWLQSRYDFADMHVVEIGCGTGCSTLAFGQVAKAIDCFELSEASVTIAKERLAYWGIGSVRFHLELFDDTTAAPWKGKLDAILLTASLEHMTHDEAIGILRLSERSLRSGGILVVCETPNRFSPRDEHTSWLPLFSMLPREIQVMYAHRSPRKGFRDAMQDAMAHGWPNAVNAMTRWGSGVSHHEFEIAFGENVHNHVTLDGYEPEITAYFPVTDLDEHIQRTFELFQVNAHRAFTRRNLNFVIEKP